MINGEAVGLALSGGGFRAALFHVGVLKRLCELGLLSQIDYLSSVSGGSIIGAFYALKYQELKDDQFSPEAFRNIIEIPFAHAVQHGIRNTAVNSSIGTVLFDVVRQQVSIAAIYRTYIQVIRWVEKEFDRHFFSKQTLAKLPESPVLIINAARLNDGKRWEFTRERMGATGEQHPSIDFSIARAVSASSAVPGLFAPITFAQSHFAGEMDNQTALVDGGIQDNQGVQALLERNCRYMICSDAAAEISEAYSPTTNPMSVLGRMTDIFMLRQREYELRGLVKTSKEAVYLTLGSKCPQQFGLPAALKERVRQIRTDLDYFNKTEIECLIYHGYTVMDHKLRTYGPTLLATATRPNQSLSQHDDLLSPKGQQARMPALKHSHRTLRFYWSRRKDYAPWK